MDEQSGCIPPILSWQSPETVWSIDTPTDSSVGFLPSQGRFRKSLRDTSGNLIPLMMDAIPTSTGAHGNVGAQL